MPLYGVSKYNIVCYYLTLSELVVKSISLPIKRCEDIDTAVDSLLKGLGVMLGGFKISVPHMLHDKPYMDILID